MQHRAFLTFLIESTVAYSHSYKVFSGDGSTEQGWPATSDWLSYEDLYACPVFPAKTQLICHRWTLNLGVLNSSCFPTYGENNSPAEMAAIKAFIPAAAEYAGVPPSLFLSMMMQESDGCVRVGNTAAAVTNPGLMQSNNGQGSCAGRSPCPREEIRLMLMDGAGEGRNYGLKQAVDLNNGTRSPRRFYLAARAYNSGPLGFVPGHLEQGGATRCYASDIANRLLGWTHRADTACSFDHPRLVPTLTHTMTPNFQATASVVVTNVSAVHAPGTPKLCSRWYLVQEGDTCDGIAEKYNTTFGRLREINVSLDAECTNLWLGYFYCTQLR
jgi:hypothetical protein